MDDRLVGRDRPISAVIRMLGIMDRRGRAQRPERLLPSVVAIEFGPAHVERIDWVKLVLRQGRSEEHTSELQSLMRISYAVFCLKTKKTIMTYKSKSKHNK